MRDAEFKQNKYQAVNGYFCVVASSNFGDLDLKYRDPLKEKLHPPVLQNVHSHLLAHLGDAGCAHSYTLESKSYTVLGMRCLPALCKAVKNKGSAWVGVQAQPLTVA